MSVAPWRFKGATGSPANRWRCSERVHGHDRLRLSRIALVTAVAFFFTLVAFGNITDYGANWKFVTHVMSMDTTFQDPDLMWRAVTDPELQHAAYGTIITWQALTALVLWIGVIRLARAVAGDRDEFAAARGVAIVGLTMGLLLYADGLPGRRRRVVRDVAVAHLERPGDGGDLRVVHRGGAPASMRTGAGLGRDADRRATVGATGKSWMPDRHRMSAGGLSPATIRKCLPAT